jgi:hypothetical protein
MIENLATGILKFNLAIDGFICQSAAWFAKEIKFIVVCLVPLKSEE